MKPTEKELTALLDKINAVSASAGHSVTTIAFTKGERDALATAIRTAIEMERLG